MNASTAKYRCYGERSAPAYHATPYYYLNAQTVAGGKREVTQLSRKHLRHSRWYLDVRVPAIGMMSEHWRCVASKHTDEKQWQNYCREEI